MARALSVTPVRPCVCKYFAFVYTSVQRHPLSKSNTFDQNFMKLVHIVEYRVNFFKIDNGPYRTMLTGVMALCI